LVAKHGAHAALRIAIGARPARPFWDVTAEALSRWAPRIHDLAPERPCRH
jgi:DNA processing protein